MPKVNLLDRSPTHNEKKVGKYAERKQLENKLIDLFGVCLTMADLLCVLGMKDHHCAKNWVKRENIQPVEINGRKRYLATDIAKALENSKMRVVL